MDGSNRRVFPGGRLGILVNCAVPDGVRVLAAGSVVADPDVPPAGAGRGGGGRLAAALPRLPAHLVRARPAGLRRAGRGFLSDGVQARVIQRRTTFILICALHSWFTTGEANRGGNYIVQGVRSRLSLEYRKEPEALEGAVPFLTRKRI